MRQAEDEFVLALREPVGLLAELLERGDLLIEVGAEEPLTSSAPNASARRIAASYGCLAVTR